MLISDGHPGWLGALASMVTDGGLKEVAPLPDRQVLSREPRVIGLGSEYYQPIPMANTVRV